MTPRRLRLLFPPLSVSRLGSALAAVTSLWAAAVAQARPLERATPEAVGMSSVRLARLTATLETYVQDRRLAGAVALVARRGKVVYLEATGSRDVESGAPMKVDSIFRIASQTKALVSTAIMMLQEEGKLLLAHPVSRHLPAFRSTVVAVAGQDGGIEIRDAARPITIRDLLTHTAGIGYGSGPAADRWAAAKIQGWYFADRDEPIRATVDRMAALPFDAQPGERFIYGYSTDILGAVVESASGLPLDRFLEERIFRPLGMTDSHFYLPEDKVERLATVYSLEAAAGIQRAPDPGHMVGQGAYVKGPRKSFSGGAGLLSTASDYARFLLMVAGGGALGDARILSPKTVELMTANHIGDRFEWRPGMGFGLGFSVRLDLGASGQPGSVGEFGWGGAYHTTYWVDPREELVVVYMTQLIPAAGIDDHDVLRALVYAAIVESGAERRSTPAVVPATTGRGQPGRD